MSSPFQQGSRRGFVLAVILAMAAGHGLQGADQGTTPASTPTATTSASNGNIVASNPLPAETDSLQLQQLQRFLSLSTEQITQLRKGLEYLEKMSPADRHTLLLQVQGRMQSVAQLNREIGPELRAIKDDADHSTLNRYIATLFPEDIQPLLDRFKAAKNPEDRQKIIAEMLATAKTKGIKPDPNFNSNPGQPPGGQRTGNNRGGRGGPPAPRPIPTPDHHN